MTLYSVAAPIALGVLPSASLEQLRVDSSVGIVITVNEDNALKRLMDVSAAELPASLLECLDSLLACYHVSCDT